MNGFVTVQEAAEKWGVTPRQVQILCKEGRIAGVNTHKPYMDYSRERRETDCRKEKGTMH